MPETAPIFTNHLKQKRSQTKSSERTSVQLTRNRQADMTEGNIIHQLLVFCWPLLVGNVFQQLYNTVNAILLGNYIGSDALAAIGVFNPINNLLLGLFSGISTGATVLVSQSYGAKNSEKLNQSVLVAIWMTILGGIFISIVGETVMNPLLRMIGTPAEVFTYAAEYSRIMFFGLVTMFFYNILSGILRGMGDSVIPLLFLIFSNILNVGLLYFFIVILGTGIKGAAYGTVISETTAGILTFIYLLRSQEKYGISIKGLKPDWQIGKQMINIGLPAGLQTSIFSVGFLLQQNLINSFGPTVIAAYAVVTRIDQFAMLPMNSFAVGITAFVGQNTGARKMNRTIEGIKQTLILSQSLTIALVSILFFFGANVMALFTKDLAVVQSGKLILRTLSAGYILVNAYTVLSGAVRGVGDTVAPLLASFICNVIIRVSLAYFLVKMTGNYQLIFVSISFSWALASAFLWIYYKKGFWQKKIRGII